MCVTSWWSLITSSLNHWSLISGIYVSGKSLYDTGCRVLGKSELNSRLMLREINELMHNFFSPSSHTYSCLMNF